MGAGAQRRKAAMRSAYSSGVVQPEVSATAKQVAPASMAPSVMARRRSCSPRLASSMPTETDSTPRE